MARGRPPGRANSSRRGMARGRAAVEVLAMEEVFQDPLSEEDADVTMEEPEFVVSSPAISASQIKGKERQEQGKESSSDLLRSGVGLDLLRNQGGEKGDGALPTANIAVEAQTPSWGDRVEEEEKSKNPAPVIEKKKTWANVVGNRDSANGIQLNYVPLSDEGVVEFTEEDTAARVSAWNNAVIGQIVGVNPKFKEVVNFVHRAWSRIEIPRIHQLQSGVFLFNFQNEESKRKVMSRQWTFNGELLLVSHWSPDYKPETKKPTKRAVWVKLPSLNLQFWTKQGIEKIVSAVGTPLGTDALTANREAIKYARALVEIDLLKPLTYEVKCKLPNGTPYTQKIQYEGLPENPILEAGNQQGDINKGKEVMKPGMDPTQVKEVQNPGSVVPNQPVQDISLTGMGQSSGVTCNLVEQGVPGTNPKKKKKKKKKGNALQSGIEGEMQTNSAKEGCSGNLFTVVAEQSSDETIGPQSRQHDPPDPGGKGSTSASFK